MTGSQDEYIEEIQKLKHAKKELIFVLSRVLAWAFCDIKNKEGTFAYLAEEIIPAVEEAIKKYK